MASFIFFYLFEKGRSLCPTLYYSIHFEGCTKAEGSFISRITEQPSPLLQIKPTSVKEWENDR